MLYPDFLKKEDYIGICALSAGVGKKLDDYLKALAVLNIQNYNVVETKSVRVNSERANSSIERANEFGQLINDEQIKMIIMASGGDSQIETIPYINYEEIKKHPKWIMGYSDPTNLLLPVTTMLDIATIYGYNASSYDLNFDLDQINNFNIIEGNLIEQKSFDKYIDFIDIKNGNNKYHQVKWKADNKIHFNGRCIGGCLDVIEKFVGNKYDYVNDFIEKYKDDGIIWYFDIFSLSAYQTYLSLLQLKNAGYFKYCKGVLFGRVAFKSTNDSKLITSYNEAFKTALVDIPYIYDLDIGHTKPRMTMINGAIIDVECEDNKGSINFQLK